MYNLMKFICIVQDLFIGIFVFLDRFLCAFDVTHQNIRNSTGISRECPKLFSILPKGGSIFSNRPGSGHKFLIKSKQ